MSQHCPPKRAYVSLHVLSDRPSSARGPACSARGQASSARGPASASGARGSTCAALHEARAAKNARPGIQRALLGICILRAARHWHPARAALHPARAAQHQCAQNAGRKCMTVTWHNVSSFLTPAKQKQKCQLRP